MPQVWHDGTSEYGARDMDLEDTVVRDGGGEREKGCLEMLALLPFMGVILYYVQVLSG